MSRCTKIIASVLSLSLIMASAAYAQVSGEAFSGFRSNSKDPILIEADELEILDTQAKAIYRGNVKVRQGGSLISTQRLEVKYNKAGKGGQGDIERLDLSGGVTATSRTNTARSDTGTFFVRNENIILSGNVRVSQGKNAATGCRLEANLRTNIAKLKSCKGSKKSKGRVKTILTPGAGN